MGSTTTALGLGGLGTGERPENIRMDTRASSIVPPAILVIMLASPCRTRNSGIPIRTAAQRTKRVSETMPTGLSRRAPRLHLDGDPRSSARRFIAFALCVIPLLFPSPHSPKVRPLPSSGTKMGS
uniref:Uncharacterized protein n=2 Tax=environmental samples TaxID=68359 RepID=A0A075GYX8_9EURY|nr:hypothetical protein [uncultured marine group II/III euryarchaeote KM3_105_E02]AIF06968.1 hypothetical protein [uncultured marine group II/III euryarchaeote KM3_198_E02]